MERRSSSNRYGGTPSNLSPHHVKMAALENRWSRKTTSNRVDWLSARNLRLDRSSGSTTNTLLALELRNDGGREFLHVTVRGLYKYAMDVVTTPFPMAPSEESSSTEAGGVSPGAEPNPTQGEGAASTSVTTIDTPPPVVPTESVPSTYRERLGGYLHPRDMRRLVSPFSASNEPELIVRRHVILCNFDPLRAIILRDRVLVIVPAGADSLLTDLERKVRGGIEEVENSIFGEYNMEDPSIRRYKRKPSGPLQSIVKNVNKALGRTNIPRGTETVPLTKPTVKATETALLASDRRAMLQRTDANTQFAELDEGEWGDIKGEKWKSLPFELQCVDAIFQVVTDGLYSETHDLQQAAVSCIQNIVSNQNGLSDGPLVDIRHIQNATSEMESRVKRYMSSLERALDDDERLALLNLTRMMTHPERFLLPAATTQVLEDEGSEPSLILEGHLEMAYTLQNTLVLIKGQIDSASELIDRKQDAARNKILLANTIVSIFSLCVGYASLVGSIFGMNLMNHLEFNDSAWVIVVCVTIVTAIMVGIFGIHVLTWTGTIPNLQLLFRKG